MAAPTYKTRRGAPDQRDTPSCQLLSRSGAKAGLVGGGVEPGAKGCTARACACVNLDKPLPRVAGPSLGLNTRALTVMA